MNKRIQLQQGNKPYFWIASIDGAHVGFVVQTGGVWPYLAIPLSGISSECRDLKVAEDYLESLVSGK